jgi:hypothetical protein
LKKKRTRRKKKTDTPTMKNKESLLCIDLKLLDKSERKKEKIDTHSFASPLKDEVLVQAS